MSNPTRNLTSTIDEVAFFYIVFVGVLLHSVVMSEIVASFLALPSIVIIPCLFGKVIIRMSKLLSEVRMFRSFFKNFAGIIPCDGISFYTISWMLGSHVMATVFLILTFLHLPILVKILPTFSLILIALNLVYERHKRYAVDLYRQLNNNIKFYLSLIIAVMISLIAVSITKIFMPFPFLWPRLYFLLPFNVQYAYRTVTNGYFTGGRWPDFLFQSLSLSIFNVEPLNLTWSGPFIIAATYASGFFILFYRISKSLEIAVLSAMFGIFINSSPIGGGLLMPFNSGTIMNAIFPFILYTLYEKISTYEYKLKSIMKTITLLALSIIPAFYIVNICASQIDLFYISPLFLIGMIVLPLMVMPLSLFLKDKSSRSLFILLFLYSVILFYMHMDETLHFVFIMLVFIIICQIVKMRSSRLLILALAMVTFVFIYLQWLNIWNIYSTNSISQIWRPELRLQTPVDFFDIKRADFEFTYREIIRYLAVFGCVLTLTSKRMEDKIMVGMLSILLLIFFFPDYQTIRVYPELSIFMAYILSKAFSSIHYRILPSNRTKRSSLNKSIHVLIIIVMLVAITPPLISPTYELSSKLSSPQDPYSYASIANYEYEAANWIKDNFPETTLIVSDYRTMLILNSLGNKVWLVDRGMDGTHIWPVSQQALMIIKFNIFKADSSEEAYRNIQVLPSFIGIGEKHYMEYTGVNEENLTIMVVLSSRTVKWIEQEDMDDIVHAQYSEVPSEYLKLFSDARYFELIYEIDPYFYIYKIKI